MYTLEKKNTYLLCMLCMLIPQVIALLLSSKNPPQAFPNLLCLLVHTSTSIHSSFQHNSNIHGTSTPSQPLLSTITTQKYNKLHTHSGLSLKATNGLHQTFKGNVRNLAKSLNNHDHWWWHMPRFTKLNCMKLI